MKRNLLLSAMLLAAGMVWSQKYNIYMGSTHAHCNFSSDVVKKAARENRELDPMNNVDNNIAAAREAGLQFYCLTDHSTHNYYTPQVWAAVGEWAEKLTEDGKFVALRGFEYSSKGGTDDMNVFNTSQFLISADLHKFQDWLALPENKEALVCYNHPDEGAYDNFSLYHEAVRSKYALIEVINGNKPKFYKRFLDALAAGYKVSPVAGCDNHSIEVLLKWRARTGIAATSLTAEDVLDAFAGRRTYATMDKELKVYYMVNGKAMGSTFNVKEDDLKFEIDASTSAATISKIEIVGEEGKVILSKEFSDAAVKWNAAVPLGEKYYFLILYEKESKDPVAWVAPVWVE